MSDPDLILVPAWGRFSHMLQQRGVTEMELVIARLAFEHAAAVVLETLGSTKSPATALTIMAREVHSMGKAAETVAKMVNDEPPRDGDDYEDRVQAKAHR